MNLERVDQIAKAVLYEGYMLYPYRPSSVKNRQRWNFGVVCPPAYCDEQVGNESSSMRTECLILGNSDTAVELKLRFLQLRVRSAGSSTQTNWNIVAGWLAGSRRTRDRRAHSTAGGIGQPAAGDTVLIPSANYDRGGDSITRETDTRSFARNLLWQVKSTSRSAACATICLCSALSCEIRLLRLRQVQSAIPR